VRPAKHPDESQLLIAEIREIAEELRGA